VIAADADRPDLTQPIDDGVGLRPVADDVAEVPDPVDRACRLEDRVQRPEVGMDVREHRDSHGGRA
jgi:hypothetical protein